MNIERSILISFFGNYLTNNVVAAIVALIPASASTGFFTPQYIAYVVLAAVVVGVLAWWAGVRGLKAGLIFGVIGFVVALATAFVTGVSGVLAQTGSLSQMFSVVPNFGPFILSVSTAVLLGFWLLPSALVGWMMRPKMAVAAPAPTTM